MMRQYLDMKRQYPEAVLFFRMGDFYETFFDDAKITSQALGITLTARDKKGDEKVPLAGIPYHALDSYLGKMIEKGYKVAICEQVEDPKLAKGVVKREVVRVVTPGTVLDGNMLEDSANNYLMAVVMNGSKLGLSFADVSTGDFRTTQFSDDDRFSRLATEVIRLKPSEAILPHDLVKNRRLVEAVRQGTGMLISPYTDDAFRLDGAYGRLTRHFGVPSLEGMGCEEQPLAVSAAGAVLDYLEETQKGSLDHIDALTTYSTSDTLVLDSTTLRNLEVSSNIRDGSVKGTLLEVLDRTVTPMGARLMKEWVHKPLVSVPDIEARLDAVAALKQDQLLQGELREALSRVKDVNRIMSRVVYGSANARDLVGLKESLRAIPGVKDLLEKWVERSGLLAELNGSLDDLGDVFGLIDRAINEEPPLTVREGGLIKDGYDDKLDELKGLSREGKNWVARLEAQERKRTGIKSLRVGYNKVFGYYIEVTKANIKLVPEDYIRKQTLAGSERFITPELKEKEEAILSAKEKMGALEYNLFTEIRERVASESGRIQESAKALAGTDVVRSLADVAVRGDFCRPDVNDSDAIKIEDGRHPVVERMLGEKFIPNDAMLDCADNRMVVLTGPNMAGKSTYMRQIALITIMAQVGSFVPAKSASIGVVDRVFTRVGAFDDLTRGQSTFMVEMVELANILHNATPRSLILLDEIGRGTSTFDGLSIAWAVTEYLVSKKNVGAKTIFATHYHQLTELGEILPGVVNSHIAIKEDEEGIIFLRKVLPGGASKSYGIEVAKIAGVPKPVLERAKEVLRTIEEENILEVKDETGASTRVHAEAPGPRPRNLTQLVLFDPDPPPHPVVEELKKVDVLNITPMEAMRILDGLKRSAEGGKREGEGQ